MKGIVFWTSHICMHSASVFEELGRHVSVIIACQSEEYGTFGSLNFKNVKVYHVNSIENVDLLISDTLECIHVNSFLRANSDVKIFVYALHKLIKNHCMVLAVNMEQYQWWTWKGYLRRLQWFYLFNVGIGRKIKAIGCTGRTGIIAFRKAAISSKRLFDFIYAVPAPDSYLLGNDSLLCNLINKANTVKFVILGQIISRKCILECINVFNSINGNYTLEIIGSGVLEQQMLSLIKNNPRIHYHGKLMPLQARDILKCTDVLLQVSKLEGWGCTVNEALMYGNRVIVSDSVGSRDLISNRSFCGVTFESGNWDDLKSCILKEINRGTRSEKERALISSWAKCIYPEAEADYFLKIIDYYSGKISSKPVAPWQK